LETIFISNQFIMTTNFFKLNINSKYFQIQFDMLYDSFTINFISWFCFMVTASILVLIMFL